MNKWFEEKFERERLRKYAKRRLRKNHPGNFLRKLSITNWLIILNVTVFVLIAVFSQFFRQDRILFLFALQTKSFFSGNYWTLLTSMFMHFEIWHLLANVFSLFFIGNFLEKLIGRKRIFWIYILSGLFAGFFYVFLSYFFGNSLIGARIFGNTETYAVGASGAIFSLLGMLAVLTPYNKVYLIAGPLIAIVLQAVFEVIFPASSLISVINLFVYFYILFSIFSIFSFNRKLIKISLPILMPFWILPIVAILPLMIIGLFISLPIGNTAHLGGLLVGIVYAFYLKKKYKKKTELIRKYFSN